MIQDDVHHVLVGHLGINIESIDSVQVFLDGTCLLEITDLVKSLVQLVEVTITFSNGIFHLFPSIKPMLMGFPSF